LYNQSSNENNDDDEIIKQQAQQLKDEPIMISTTIEHLDDLSTQNIAQESKAR